MSRRIGNTKERILEESLNLFSIDGYEAVSIRTIADAVGIGNSALYKHFKSKREIFESIVSLMKARYLQACENVNETIRGIESVKKICLTMFDYQTTDSSIVAFRRMLLLEKFKNPEIAEIYKLFFVDIPLDNQVRIFENLQREGLMIAGNPRVFAIELYAPFYLYHFVEHDPKALRPLFEKHLEHFFEIHFMKERKEKKI